MGTVTWLLYDDLALGGVMTLAMILNLLVASIMGVLIPMIMAKLGRDPAVGSSVMITAITDTGGFFIFLGWRRCFCFKLRTMLQACRHDRHHDDPRQYANRQITGTDRCANGDQHHQRFRPRRALERRGLEAWPAKGLNGHNHHNPASTAIGIFAITSLNAVTNSSSTSAAAIVETRLRPFPISTLTMV